TNLNLQIESNLTVSSGVFDLGAFTASRLTGGGTLTIADGAMLKIGGTNSIPANYTTHSIGATSNINYSGIDQTVSVFNTSQQYGHLKISGTGAELSSDITVRNNLSVSGTCNVDTYTLRIGGSLSSSGGLTATSGTIEMNGITTQQIPAGSFSSNTIKNLIINNNAGVTLAGTLSLIDALYVNNGTFNTGGHLTLKSTPTGTARVATINSIAAQPIIGNVTAERYIPGKRRYRLLTSSVTTSGILNLTVGQENLSIWGNWQNQGNILVGNIGTLITGGTSADGFDTQTGNASLFTYDDVNRAYVRFSSANGKRTKYTPLKAGIAYYMFVYGDRLNSVGTSNPNNTTLKAYGTLLTGDQVYTPSTDIPVSNVTDRYTMLGNPYASPINWGSVTRSNISNTYWGWDPNLSGTGGYVTVSTIGSVTIIAPFSGSTGLDQYIQPGQGFFVKTIAPSPILTIREVDKVANFNPHAFSTVQTLGATTDNRIPLMAINLQYNSGSTRVLADGVVAAFDARFSNAINDEDASKMMNTAEAISILNGQTMLSIDARQMPQVNDTVKLEMVRITKTQYTLQIFSQKMDGQGLQPYLEDNYLKTSQVLSLTDTNSVVFNVTPGVVQSAAADRFRIVFHAPIVLPVNFISVNAVAKDKDIDVEWKISEENGIEKYEVNKSTDGNQFSKVAEIKATQNSAVGNYKWVDANVESVDNYYRIHAIDKNGRGIYSKIVFIKVSAAKTTLRIFPNPVTGHILNVEITDNKKGAYQLTLVNAQGQQVMRKIIVHEGGRFINQIRLHNSIQQGLYFLKILSANGKEISRLYIE
ncbi:MAG TPA: T9SS type A sorting domain-containing protein, partial [Flavitalea sp.]|nr:T9SS type A sorting domain-containing protein [Flavitalea sp.]